MIVKYKDWQEAGRADEYCNFCLEFFIGVEFNGCANAHSGQNTCQVTEIEIDDDAYLQFCKDIDIEPIGHICKAPCCKPESPQVSPT